MLETLGMKAARVRTMFLFDEFEKANKPPPLTGHSFGYTFGRPTGWWDNPDSVEAGEVRIGCTREGYEVAVSTGKGSFPLNVSNPRLYHPTLEEAEAFIKENAERFGWKRSNA